MVLKKLTLSDEGLIDVQKYFTAFDDHSLDGQVLANVFRLADLVVHNPGQVLQLALGELETLPLHMVVRRVSKQFVQGDDVPRNLPLITPNFYQHTSLAVD